MQLRCILSVMCRVLGASMNARLPRIGSFRSDRCALLQVKAEQSSTDSLYAAREASEEEGAGRVSHEQFMVLMKHIQAHRGSELSLIHI